MRTSKAEISPMRPYQVSGKNPYSKSLFLTHTSTRATSMQAQMKSLRNCMKPYGLSIQKINQRVWSMTTKNSAKKCFQRSLSKKLRLSQQQKESRYITLSEQVITTNYPLSAETSTNLISSNRLTIKRTLSSSTARSGYSSPCLLSSSS